MGESNDSRVKNSQLSLVSNVFLIIGAAAWLPYFYVHYYYQLDVAHLPFLSLHITGMLSGGLIKLF